MREREARKAYDGTRNGGLGTNHNKTMIVSQDEKVRAKHEGWPYKSSHSDNPARRESPHCAIVQFALAFFFGYALMHLRIAY